MGKRKKRTNSEEYSIGTDLIEQLPYKIQVKTTREIDTLYGRVDIVINAARPVLIEVKIDSRDVKTALGQLLFYAECFEDPELFICCKNEIPEKYLRVMEKYGIKDWRSEGKKYKDLL